MYWIVPSIDQTRHPDQLQASISGNYRVLEPLTISKNIVVSKMSEKKSTIDVSLSFTA